MSPDESPPLTRGELRRVFNLYASGRLREALAAGVELLRRHPREPALLNVLGAVQAALGELDAARASYEQALALRPDIAEGHFHLGSVLMQQGRLDAAGACFERAVQLKPGFVEAHAKLCQCLERGGRLPELPAALARARASCPGGQPALALREAELLKRRGEIDAARELLERAPQAGADAETREDRLYLLGDLCDRLDDVPAAFGYLQQANRLVADSPAAQGVNGAAYLESIDSLSSRFDADWVGGWQPVEVDDGRADPVFLVGFPRSGTTLLDTVLRGHPAVAVLEEKPTVAALETAARKLPGGYPHGLAALDAGQLRQLRQAYFTELDRHLDTGRGATVVVDKLPLNLVHAGLIHRVLPRARFLFARRHPCDCVLSCYMRSFRMNEGMVHFLDLGAAAQLYDRAMGLWQRYLKVLPLRVHDVVYEELVTDFEDAITPALEFLGLEWNAALANFSETARARGQIDTPSYDQVTQGLYTRASERWLRYRDYLEPALPTLLPWAQRLGYPGAAEG